MGSSWDVGSSSSSTRGCSAMTEARFRSCFCPPDRASTGRENHSSMPKKLAISATRRRMTGVAKPRLSIPKASSCHTRSVTICSSGFCSTKPISAACRRASSAESGSPKKEISPVKLPCGVSAGFSARSSVDLPPPDGPTSATVCPGRMSMETPRITSVLPS